MLVRRARHGSPRTATTVMMGRTFGPHPPCWCMGATGVPFMTTWQEEAAYSAACPAKWGGIVRDSVQECKARPRALRDSWCKGGRDGRPLVTVLKERLRTALFTLGGITFFYPSPTRVSTVISITLIPLVLLLLSLLLFPLLSL